MRRHLDIVATRRRPSAVGLVVFVVMVLRQRVVGQVVTS